MKYEQAKIFANYKDIKHAFFTKIGGYSTGVYESLNCSLNVGDCEQFVLKNIDSIKANFEAREIISLKQIHGNNVVVVDEHFDFNLCNQQIEGDAIVTNTKNVCIAILTADCAPVLIYDTNNEIIGAIHCGWKSARYGAIENTIRAISKIATKEMQLIAAIGPCIHKESYIVQQDFISNFADNDLMFFEENLGEYRFDLPMYVKHKLTKLGVISVEVLDIDTHIDPNFFSFRKANMETNGICGRQFSRIMLK